MIRVLFICHGNICRSPMAEFVFKKKIAELGIADQFYVASAATSTEEIWNGVGNPVYPPAKTELLKHGITCEGKRATLLKKSDYDSYDYLIGMDDANIRNIKRMTGGDMLSEGGKIAMLLDFTGESYPIADPWYTDRFDNCYMQIDMGCDAFIKYLLENA